LGDGGVHFSYPSTDSGGIDSGAKDTGSGDPDGCGCQSPVDRSGGLVVAGALALLAARRRRSGGRN